MKVMASNGSPRKNGNTATLLNKALEGASSQGAETELINLYDLNYKGCMSCFSCRLKEGKSYGKCAVQDELAPIFERVTKADALMFGSPVYSGTATAEIRAFLERLIYPLFNAVEMSTLFKKRIPTGFIYTMNVNAEQLKEFGYEQSFANTENALKLIFGTAESILVTDTCQFDDYSKYDIAPFIDPEQKIKRHNEEFPKECRKAFDMGAKFARQTDLLG